MKSRGTWIHTRIPRPEVSEYKHQVIQRSAYLFKPGTTIIDASKPAIPAMMRHVRKNSFYVGILSINYARMFPLGQTTGLTLGGGLINMDGWGVVAETSVILGGVRHFFEPGIMGARSFAQSIKLFDVKGVKRGDCMTPYPIDPLVESIFQRFRLSSTIGELSNMMLFKYI